jgi:protocatechuate 3,4-dioxygenase beta subunit
MTGSRQTEVRRRDILYVLGSLVAVGFVGCSGDDTVASPTSSSTSTASTNSTCVVTPSLTEGPYFVDERLNRSDLRTDPSTGVVKPGVPLNLTVRLSEVTAAGACTSLAGALVDMWHCDALGVYSDVAAQNTIGQKFLRGYQISDPDGIAQFMTIYPGWYTGRAVHIHFKVRTNPDGASGLEFTSQMFFDDRLTNSVYAQAPYNTRGQPNTTNASDSIYQSGGSQLLFPLAPAGSGYSGTFNVGVRV